MIFLVMGDSTTTTTAASIVQRRINTLNSKTSNDSSKTTNTTTAGVKLRQGVRSAGIPSEKRMPKKPVPLPRSGLKPPSTVKVAVTSISTASKFATSRMTASQIRYASRRTVETNSNTKTSSTFTGSRKTVVKPAPPIAIRASTANLTKTKKESSIPQVSKRQPKLTKESNKEKDKENKPNEISKECKCDKNQNCICKDNHEETHKGGSTSLKKTKSTRKPHRRATYVSELNKDIRKKFLKQKSEGEQSGEKDRPSSSTKEKPKVKPKPTKKVEQINERNLQKAGRVVVHCPLHSKFANQLSSRFIKARCIPECPHYNDAKRSRSNSPASTVSNASPSSSPAVHKRVTGNRVNSGKTIPKVAKTVPYVITTNKKTTTLRNGTSSNVRVRSAPAVSRAPVKKPVQSYLVRNGIIPDPVKANVSAVPRTAKKKVRQKSFRLSRTKSKSFKYKNKPSVVKRAQQINKELQQVSAIESDDNLSTTDFETDELSADCLSASDGGHSSSEEVANQQRAVPKTKKPLRQKSLRLSRSKSRSKSFRAKKKVTKRRNSKKSTDSVLSEDSLHFDDDSLGDQGVNSLDLNLEDLELVEGEFLGGEGSGDDEDLEFETDDELVSYYFEVFKREFPEIVEQAHLTKEEMVSSHPSIDTAYTRC